KRLKLFKNSEKLRCDLFEFKISVNINYWSKKLLSDFISYKSFKSCAKLLKVTLSKCQSGGIHMPSKVLKKIRTTLNSLIKVKTGNTPGRSCYKTIRFSQYYCRPIVCF